MEQELELSAVIGFQGKANVQDMQVVVSRGGPEALFSISRL